MHKISYSGILISFLLIFIIITIGKSHDLKIQKINLTQKENGEFQFWSRINTSLPEKYKMPFIKGNCHLIKDTLDVGSYDIIKFKLSCPPDKGFEEDTIIFLWDFEGIILFIRSEKGETSSHFFPNTQNDIRIPLSKIISPNVDKWQAISHYINLGIHHILQGIDHLLFVLGLLLLVDRRWVLFKTITAFTVAHSITLTLATLGFVKAPSGLIDTLVALSIVFVAIELVHKNQGKQNLSIKYPWIVAFTFGLLHGFGFASALNTLGLSGNQLFTALFSFNVGVEIGQLIFVLGFLIWVWAAKQLEVQLSKKYKYIPAYSIGTIATFWFCIRISTLFSIF